MDSDRERKEKRIATTTTTKNITTTQQNKASLSGSQCVYRYRKECEQIVRQLRVCENETASHTLYQTE